MISGIKTVMTRKKQSRYAAAKELPNIIQPKVLDFKNFILEDTFDSSVFCNNNPVSVEIGCGKGEYTISLARRHRGRNFIGIDIKGDRMMAGAEIALSEGLSNVCFIRLRIEYIAVYFPENFFSEGYITFPDPHISQESGKSRLTSKRFLDLYRKVFVKGSTFHLKTDSDVLYEFSKSSVEQNGGKVLEHTCDLHGSLKENEDMISIKTTYEKRYIAAGEKIKYIRFSL